MADSPEEIPTEEKPEKVNPPTLSFVGNETVRIELGEGTWVDVRKDIAFDKWSDIMSGVDPKNTAQNINLAMPLVKESVVDWSDKDVECTPQNIENLGTAIILHLMEKILPLYIPEKKS
ncbi:MAG: hypothetical protein V3T43_06165 [Nitrosomonadaceae bacterium]